MPRLLKSDEFVAVLKGRPKGVVILMYPKEDVEAWSLASAIGGALDRVGWEHAPPIPIDENVGDPKYSNLPGVIRAGGGIYGVTVKSNKMTPEGPLNVNDPLTLFLVALREGGITSSEGVDRSLPDNTFRVIVSPKH